MGRSSPLEQYAMKVMALFFSMIYLLEMDEMVISIS